MTRVAELDLLCPRQRLVYIGNFWCLYRSLECHIAAILLAAKAKYPSRWSHEAFASALKTIEYSDLSVDVTRVFWEMGREIADPEQLGEMVREYLVATGEKDTFSCRYGENV